MTTELKSPQQQIYDAVFIKSLNLTDNTYMYLPDGNAGYPFVYVGEQFDQDIANKSTVAGNVQQTLHIYGTVKQRRQVSTLVNNLKRDLRTINHTENFNVTVKGIDGQIILDNSTSTNLLHGIVEVEFSFN